VANERYHRKNNSTNNERTAQNYSHQLLWLPIFKGEVAADLAQGTGYMVRDIYWEGVCWKIKDGVEQDEVIKSVITLMRLHW